MAADLSLRDLADRVGVSNTTFSCDQADEYRRICVDPAQRIVEAIGVTGSLTVPRNAEARP